MARRVAPNHVVLGAIFGTLLAAQIGSIGAEAWRLKYGQPEDQSGEVVVPATLDEVETAPAH